MGLVPHFPVILRHWKWESEMVVVASRLWAGELEEHPFRCSFGLLSQLSSPGFSLLQPPELPI